MQFLEFLLVGILAFWFFLSVLAQLATWEGAPKPLVVLSHWFQQRDWLSVIPAWNFFAPNPGTTDYHLLYRDKLESDDLSVWREIPIEKEPSLLKAIWNPHKRKSKVLSDVVSSVNITLGTNRIAAFEQAKKEFEEGRLPPAPEDQSEKSDDERITDRTRELYIAELRWLQVSIPYLIILNYLSHIPHPVFSSSTQFLLAETRVYDKDWEPKVLFVSEFHKLP